jgi:DNA-binding beta-propeller fold protein YncE
MAHQIWNLGTPPPGAIELPPDPYTEAHIDLRSLQVWGEIGTGPGQFNHPRGIALGPDGNLYVVDSDNHRIQVFDPNGTFLHQWGSNCNLAESLGCTDPDGDGPLHYGDGQFQEPWGIALGPDGRVYVADTWNHRIQVFDPNGTFLAKWGTFGQTGSDTALLYGPRDVAVDPTGRVFVTDTGNKRILVYDTQGSFLHQWGGGGIVEGHFEEPVGLAFDENRAILYVADTWNQRVQAFDTNYLFVREWPVEAWYGESVVNKPYLAVDGQGRVYLTDPEGYRVAVFDHEGELQATFGRYGFDQDSFSLPVGIAVDAEGTIYVSDTDGQRIIRFEPLP